MQKQLFLLRHGDSLPANINKGINDFERILSPEGIEECQIIGKFLQDKQQNIDYILASNAKRTTQTAENIKNYFPKSQLETTHKLYNASANEILDLISTIDNKINNLMIVCHNPGISNLATLLLENNSKENNKSFVNFSTCGLTLFKVSITDWVNIMEENLELVFYKKP